MTTESFKPGDSSTPAPPAVDDIATAQAALDAAKAAQKVTFDERQQAKVNDLIQEAMGRSARDTRAQLRAANDRIAAMEAASLLPSTAAAELEATNARLAASRAELTANENAVKEAALKASLVDAATKAGFISPTDASKLLLDGVGFVDGVAVAVDAHGQPKLNQYGEHMTVEEFAKEFAAKNAYLVRGDIRGGIGSTPASQSTLAQETHPLTRYFGKGSDPIAANRFAMSNPRAYSRMRIQAREEGLI